MNEYFELDLRKLKLGGENLADVSHDGYQVEGFAFQLELLKLELAQVEQIVDERLHKLCLTRDEVAILDRIGYFLRFKGLR